MLLAIADLPETVRQAMMEKAEGNPFFLEEIIRHLIDQGHLVRHKNNWRAGPNLDRSRSRTRSKVCWPLGSICWTLSRNECSSKLPW